MARLICPGEDAACDLEPHPCRNRESAAGAKRARVLRQERLRARRATSRRVSQDIHCRHRALRRDCACRENRKAVTTQRLASALVQISSGLADELALVPGLPLSRRDVRLIHDRRLFRGREPQSVLLADGREPT